MKRSSVRSWPSSKAARIQISEMTSPDIGPGLLRHGSVPVPRLPCASVPQLLGGAEHVKQYTGGMAPLCRYRIAVEPIFGT